jgi:HTH-type transcriptional regulator, transcriptional repressor of NAD biosynthesis genes
MKTKTTTRSDDQRDAKPDAKPDTDTEPDAKPVRRLGLMGGESSGKTTLARALAAQLQTLWVPEYGRQRWEELRQTLSVEQLVDVAQQQVAWEDQHAAQGRVQTSGWLICDTTPLTTLQYCLHDHGSAPNTLQALARRPYDLVVVCEPDFDFVQDGCRRDDSFRLEQHQWTLARLGELGQEFITVTGPREDRVQQVLKALGALEGAKISPQKQEGLK